MTDMELKEFKEMLYSGEVEFVYVKMDGSERRARGTMNPAILREHGIPTPEEKDAEAQVKKGVDVTKRKRAMPADSVLYFDLDKDSFRSFKKDSLVSFERH